MENTKTVLVCVTAQQSSHNLVKAGKAIAEKNAAQLEVVSVLPVEQGEKITDVQTLEKLHQSAKNAGGEMAVFFSDDPILTLSAYIAKRKPLTIVTGFPGEKSNNFISTVHLLLPHLNISMVDAQGVVYNLLPCQTSEEAKI